MKRVLAILLALSCLLLCACGAAETEPEETEAPVSPAPSADSAGPLVEPVYPSMAPKPNQEDYLKENGWEVEESYYTDLQAWQADLDALRDQPEGSAEGLDPFFAGCMRELLADGQGGNRVCSPMNIYMALAMLAQVTGGESRQQILDLLGSEDLEALRQQAASLWQLSYQNDGQVTSVLANSLWMRQDMNYVPETLEDLAKYCYAASFRGEMGSAEYDALLQSWLNEQTGGLLQQQAAALHMAPETVLALASTIYFKAPWVDSFSESNTRDDVFHSPDGDETVPFLHNSQDWGAYYWGEHFGAAALAMENGGDMWLLLPEEGMMPQELLNDREALEFLLLRNKYEWKNITHPTVNLALPKFDVSSDLDLIESLRALGVTDVFDAQVSDFSPLTTEADHLAVSQAKHAARVLIDEHGCEAAAYTVIMTEWAAAFDEDEIDFVLDRPFLFVITNAAGLPLFVGLVQHPAG